MTAVKLPQSIRARTSALVLLLVIGGLLLGVKETPSLAEVEIPGVPQWAIERAGIRFLKPESTPVINESQAQGIAYLKGPSLNLPIAQTILVRRIDASTPARTDRLVWVNYIDLTQRPTSSKSPGLFPSGPWRPEPAWAELEALPGLTYRLIFVDAMTGEYLDAFSG